MSEVQHLNASDAVLIQKFGDLGLIQGEWRILGQADDWDRALWPMPVFVRHQEMTGRTFRVFYDDDNPNRTIREELVTNDSGEIGPMDGLLGYGAAEKVLTRLLS